MLKEIDFTTNQGLRYIMLYDSDYLTEEQALLECEFGGCCGKVPHNMLADYMERAFYSFEDTPKELTWHYAYKSSPLGEYNPKEVKYD